MTFSFALAALRLGGIVRRKTWVPGLVLILRSGVILVFVSNKGHGTPIVSRAAIGEASQWCPTQASLLADDWERIEGTRANSVASRDCPVRLPR